MKTALIHFINIDELTSFKKANFNLLLEKSFNNFFNKSINYFNLFKQECPETAKNTFHFFIPLHHMDEVRVIEKLPDYSAIEGKKFICINIHTNNSVDFNVFRENYKNFLYKINGENFFKNFEIFILENVLPYSDIKACPINEKREIKN